MTRTTLIDLNPNEYNKWLHYYLLLVDLDRCNGSYNTTDSPFDIIYVSNKTEDVNLSVFNMIIRINGSKILS